MLRAVLPPLITAYVLFAAMAVLAWRRPVARPIARGEGSTRVRLGRVVRTTVVGYVELLAVVLIYLRMAGSGAFMGEEDERA